MEIVHGLPHLTVILPSRQEKCRFALLPVNHKVGDLVDMIKEEDRGVDRAAVFNSCGVRISSTSSIQSLLSDTFLLQINNKKFLVKPPEAVASRLEDVDNLSDIRSLVAQLHEVLNVSEYYTEREHNLSQRLENLRTSIQPMEEANKRIAAAAYRRQRFRAWTMLSLMAVHFGVMARLTWWEYSWDIMEPVAFFVSIGMQLAFYAYYCISHTGSHMSDWKNRNFLLYYHANAATLNLDIDRYNQLKREIAELEYDLRRLRDPLNLQMSPSAHRLLTDDLEPPSDAAVEPQKCQRLPK